MATSQSANTSAVDVKYDVAIDHQIVLDTYSISYSKSSEFYTLAKVSSLLFTSTYRSKPKNIDHSCIMFSLEMEKDEDYVTKFSFVFIFIIIRDDDYKAFIVQPAETKKAFFNVQ
ncbi:unnamed protein product [Didymodactylos carnosus]|uniref:Uncharacterized protein n=1 Tax=Didymodactylos carnosus TaxID=1234261 RepID=A0A814ZCU2_9BILA|nr:unnamed protein product [Didymodactylos carnosus]CAF4005648.1 unnamed protein product [Didymodactylos carnosus]